MNHLARIGVDRTALLVLAVMGLSFLLQAVEVVMAQVWLFGVLAVVLYATEWLVSQRVPVLTKVLSRIRIGLTVRVLLRQILLLGLFASVGATGTAAYWWTVGGMAVFFVLTLAYDLLRLQTLRRARLPVGTRNLDLSGLRLPTVPGFLRPLSMTRVFLADVPLVFGGIGFLLGGPSWLAAGGSSLTVAAALAAVVATAPAFLAHLRMPSDEEVITAVGERLSEYHPDVALYFTFGVGSQNGVYQANMWLEALERIDRRTVVVFREHANLPHLAPTSLPVVCVPRADDLAALDLSTVRVALYPGNAGKNIHLVQRAEIKHVFVGHGDSDKLPSSNRVSRIFDEIWVAGRGGRERYQRVRHAIDDRDVVEVGRPQLVEVTGPRPPRERAVPTVLYAPTWEGVDDNNYLTSADTVGSELVERLLAGPGPVRVVYKPHPLLGKRSSGAAAAHRRIMDMVERANDRLEPVAADDLRELDGLRRRIEEFQEGAASRSLTEAEIADHRAVVARWHELYWTSAGPLRHHVVTGTLPSLFSCFNQADVMVSDISSVVADFVASGKPYAVADLWDLGDDEFRRQYPSAGAGYVLRPGLVGLDTLLAAGRAPADDALAERRVVLREYLLGPDEPDAQSRFGAAVDDLYARAVRDFPLGTVAAPIPADPFTPVPERMVHITQEEGASAG
ncbi:glycerophosphotransferase [Nocardiopsis sp. CT-R113]|uniref:Glycerophosphotransferase n=1 Tax=Nocardiopsis codii TaxID=3065942 RepID=A0ABU7K1A3_9ACTN|nr:glycerophosphotransferase [Nocardiopsis sp. CT-R113]MEE2036034.1 glycerophosphotransferase [Nocardiopsis sp. CT-R113]